MRYLKPSPRKKNASAVRYIYLDKCPERIAGIEPTSSVWETEVITIIQYPHTMLIMAYNVNYRYPELNLTKQRQPANHK